MTCQWNIEQRGACSSDHLTDHEPFHTQVSVKYQDQEHKMNLKCTGAVATCAENNRPCTELKINSLQYVQHDLTCSHSETIDPMKFKSIHTHSETHSETRDPMKFKSITV